jgi:ribosome-binding factor A
MGFHQSRMRESLRKKIALIIKERIRDPRVPDLVTVTEVDLSPDTRHATVYLSMYGDTEQREGALGALNKAAAYIQHEVSGTIRTKFTPQLHFKMDAAIDRTSRIHSLLDSISDELE